MFSKCMMFLRLVMPFLLICGCADEDRPFRDPVHMDMKGKTQCLSEAAATWLDFAEGRLSEREVKAFWSCTRQAIETFLINTEGQQKGRYQATELRHFMHRFFLGDLRMTDSLLRELMEIKRVFVGGAVDSVTRQELDRTFELFHHFEEIMLTLRPHMKFFAGIEWGSFTVEEEKLVMERALKALLDVAWTFGDLLKASEQSYSLERLESLLKEIGRFYPSASNSFARAGEYVPLIGRLKAMVVAPPRDAVTSDQWRSLFSSLARIYGIWVRLKHDFQKDLWSQPEELRTLDVVFYQAEALLTEALARRESRAYTFDELTDLFSEMQKHDLLFESVDSRVISNLLPVISDRIFRSENEAENGQGAIMQGHIARLFDELNLWLGVQKRIHHVVDHKDWNVPPEPGLEAAARSLERVANGPWPLIQDPKGRLIFLENGQGYEFYDKHSLMTLNWQRALVRLLIKGYSQDDQRRQIVFGLNADELKKATHDLFELAVSVGFLEPGGEKVWQRIFREGNLFMPRTNVHHWPQDKSKEEYLSFEEGVEYLAFVISGIKAVNLIQAQVFPEGQQVVEAEVFRAAIKAHQTEYLQHLPGLRGFLEAGKEGLWDRYERTLENTVRANGYSDDPVTYADMMEMWILLQYIETFFARFDEDNSGGISISEGWKAYSYLKGGMSTPKDQLTLLDQQIQQVFASLGRIDVAMKVGENGFGSDVKGGGFFEANRLRVAQIIARLARF